MAPPARSCPAGVLTIREAFELRLALVVCCALVAASAVMAAPAGNVAWQESFAGPTAPTIPGTDVTVAAGVAHYVKPTTGWIHRLVFELPRPISTREYPYFTIRARDVRGRIFVQFKMGDEWPQKLNWTICGWSPQDFETTVVDLRKLGDEVSAIWLNSDSSVAGAEWYLDWMRIVREPEPVRLDLASAGSLAAWPRERLFQARLVSRQDASVTLALDLRVGEASVAQQTVELAAGRTVPVRMSYQADPGTPLRLVAREQGTQEEMASIRASVPPLLEARLVSPHYKNTIYATQALKEVVVAGRVNAETALLREMGATAGVLGEAATASLREVAIPRLTTPDLRLAVPAKELRPGSYTLKLTVRRGEATVAEQTLALRSVPPSPVETRLREDNVLLVAGKPFFPIGFYDIPTEDFELASRAGVNTVSFSGGGQGILPRLDAAAKCGMKVVIHSTWRWFSPDREKMVQEVDPIKAHPAILAWYLRDEPSTASRDCGPDVMRALYHEMHRLDPYHPSFTTFCVPPEYGLYADTMDLFAIDPYPVDCAPLTQVSDLCDRAQAAIAGSARALWIIPQAFGSEQGPQTWWRIPTIEEERAMTYLALIHGAKGIIFYRYDVQEYVPQTKGWKSISTIPQTYPKLWEGFVGLIGELKELAPVLLAPEPVGKRELLADPPVHAAERHCEGERVVLAVNPTYQEARVRLRVPGIPAATTVTTWPDGQPVKMNRGVIEATFAPLQVRIYRMRPYPVRGGRAG